MRFGGMELILILAIIVLVFGGTLIPKLLKSTSSSIKIFKKEMDEIKKEDAEDAEAKEAEESKK